MNTKVDKAEYIDVIERIRAGDNRAMATLIGHFQDLAMGLAFSWAGNIDIAREIAQEAFLDAYINLRQLNDPAAFPAWFRQIVIKHCDRVTRRRKIDPHWLKEAPDENDPESDAASEQERENLRMAIAALTPEQRQVVALQYFAELTGSEIAEFLQIPLSTVKQRLRLARKSLREEAESLMKNTIDAMRPSSNDNFSTDVQFFIALHAGDDALATDMLQARPELANATQDWDPELARLRVLPFPTHATALITAVEFDNIRLATALLDAGADPNGQCGCATAESPIWAAAMMNRKAHVELLLSRGANPNVTSAAGNTPLHVAAMRGYNDIAKALVAAGANCSALDGARVPAIPLVAYSSTPKLQRTPADWALLNGHQTLAQALGAQSSSQQYRQSTRIVEGVNGPMLETGLKAIDFFTPIPLGGLVRIKFGAGVGMFLLIAELMSRFARAGSTHTVWTGFSQPPFDTRFDAELAEFGLTELVEPYIAHSRESPELRRSAYAAGIERARALAADGQHVLAIVLSTEGFENDVDASLPDLRRKNQGSITTIVVTPFRHEPEPTALVPPFDVQITFDRQRSQQNLYPAIYPQHSFSNARFTHDHEQMRSQVVDTFRTCEDVTLSLLDTRGDPQSMRVAQLLRLFSQPFNVTEAFGGKPGTYVPFAELMQSLQLWD